MTTLLVTGAAGFIGSGFVHYWRKEHPEDRIVALDALTYAGNKANLDGLQSSDGFEFVHGSICDEALVERLLAGKNINTIVHFAAESHVDRSISSPDAFIETNVIGTHVLLKAARNCWLDRGAGVNHRFHHVSTDEVYGSLAAGAPAFSETTPYAPNSPYAASKAASDHLVRAWHRTWGLQTTTSNCSNNYGPRHFPEKLIPLCLLNILRGKPLPIYGDGRQVRDWLYVEDHVRGIEQILQSGSIGATYNIGGDNEWANIDVVKLLCAMADQRFAANPDLARLYPDSPCARGIAADSLIRFVKDRPGHDTRYAIDAGRIRRELGFEPLQTFESGLERTVDWYLANPSWWRPILARERPAAG